MSATSGYDENELLLNVLGPPDYDNFGEPTPWANKKSSLMGLTITFMVLSWLFVSFRLWVRFRIVRSPWWDDLFVVLYLITGSLGGVALLLSIPYGYGQHMLLITVGQAGKYLVTFYMFNICLNCAASFIKLSLLFQYLRIFEKGSWPYRLALFAIGLVTLWGTAFVILAIIPCWPISDFWYSPTDAKCWGYGAWSTGELTATFYSHTILNIILDLIILAIPFNLYFQASMTFKMRLGLLALLLMGALVNFLSVWRLQTLVQHKAGRYPTHDTTWYGPISLILALLECDCASICASIPIFWPVLSPYLGAIFVTQEVSVEHEYRDDVEAKMPGSSDSTMRPGSQTELRPLEYKPASIHFFYDDKEPEPLELVRNQPGTQTRVRSDSVRDKKSGWIKI